MAFIKCKSLFCQSYRFLKIGLRTAERRIGTCRIFRVYELMPLLLLFPHIFHPAQETLEPPCISPYARVVQAHLSFLQQDRFIIT